MKCVIASLTYVVNLSLTKNVSIWFKLQNLKVKLKVKLKFKPKGQTSRSNSTFIFLKFFEFQYWNRSKNGHSFMKNEWFFKMRSLYRPLPQPLALQNNNNLSPKMTKSYLTGRDLTGRKLSVYWVWCFITKRFSQLRTN